MATLEETTIPLLSLSWTRLTLTATISWRGETSGEEALVVPSWSFYPSQPQTQSVVRQYLHALAQHPPQYRPSHLIHDCIQHQNCGVSSQNVKTNHKCKVVQKFFKLTIILLIEKLYESYFSPRKLKEYYKYFEENFPCEVFESCKNEVSGM